ncbi:unnamed protein product [Rotaria magnacalcarata]|uniref:Uncharacterized protein n=1 Tax=Rotaria magnacalcarata TaxID=392030 RepID=A0A816PTB5_9BILA|nr:unnamed protein product [Rotaria magnacalcarata]
MSFLKIHRKRFFDTFTNNIGTTSSQPNTSHTQLSSTVNSTAIYDEPLYSNTFNHLTTTDACLGFSNTLIVHTPYHHQQIHSKSTVSDKRRGRRRLNESKSSSSSTIKICSSLEGTKNQM